MAKWLKENLVLVAGIALPVLLVAGFMALNRVPAMLLEQPKYDFLMVGYRYNQNRTRDFQLSFDVRDEKVVGTATPLDDANRYLNRQYAVIFRYIASENRFVEVGYELPDGIDDLEETLRFDVSEVAGLSLDSSTRSPDEFTFEYLDYRGRGGLLGEIFGMRRRDVNPYVLSKGGAHFPLPKTPNGPNYYQHDLQFLGWIISTENQQ